MARPALLVVGDARHGVARFARQLAGAVQGIDGGPPAVAVPPGRGSVHVHYTEALWGENSSDAALELERLAQRHRVTVTLHDVPQLSDGSARLPARVRSYRRVVRAARGIVCNSWHERALLQEMGILDGERDVEVIPLPIIDADALPLRPANARRHEVALLGFFYPGKGHEEAIEAVAALDRHAAPAVVALGPVSANHEDELIALTARATALGVNFSLTGWLGDGQLKRRARAAAVPLAAHRHISASGSIGSWLAAGRRPLVADSRYAREIAMLRPDTIIRYDPDELPRTIERVLDGAIDTWLSPRASLRPDLDDCAQAYLRWWACR